MNFAVFIVLLSVSTCVFGEYVVQMLNGFPLRKNFIDAHAECVRKALILATPDTNEDNKILRDFINNHGLTSVWISANDMIREGEFQWMTTGKAVVNSNMWHVGQPKHYAGESCVLLDHIHTDLYWSEVSCTSLALVICQPASEETVAIAKRRIQMLQQALEQK